MTEIKNRMIVHSFKINDDILAWVDQLVTQKYFWSRSEILRQALLIFALETEDVQRCIISIYKNFQSVGKSRSVICYKIPDNSEKFVIQLINKFSLLLKGKPGQQRSYFLRIILRYYYDISFPLYRILIPYIEPPYPIPESLISEKMSV